LHKLGSLDADVLKFVVDAAAPLPELAWAQQNVHFSLAELVKSYTAVSYRLDRLQDNQTTWPDDTYELARILREGGICVDQAYFATEAGKARGVPRFFQRRRARRPTRVVRLSRRRARWQLDAGRIPEEKFLTGLARDPQTWGNLSDHELAFLAEGFRALPTYQQSRTDAAVAVEYLQLGHAAEAQAAARKPSTTSAAT